MGQPVIVFSHANGFPAGTYRLLFEAWRAAGFVVHAVEKFGHDPRYPITSNWPHLRQQLIDFIDAKAPKQRVHLVGHSLGGFLSLLVACKRPDLAASVVLIDSPVPIGWRARAVGVAKATGLMARFSPGKVSRNRRYEWPSAEAMHSHFKAKSAFARFEPQVLQDYVRSGAEKHAGKVRLAFQREVETRIYNTLPHHFNPLLRQHPPQCPVVYLGGTQSHEGRLVGMAGIRALTHGRIAWVEGTHLFPFERPLESAAAVVAQIQALTIS